MALNYSIAMLRNPQKPDEAPKAYAKSQIARELTLKELSRRVAGQTTVSRADVSAVLISTVENMITRDGEVHVCRPVHQIGAHATGWNDKSIGICYEGGLNEDGQPADTRTYAQKCSLLDLLRQLKSDYPQAKILGHYQLSASIHKACPCFDAKACYREL